MSAKGCIVRVAMMIGAVGVCLGVSFLCVRVFPNLIHNTEELYSMCCI